MPLNLQQDIKFRNIPETPLTEYNFTGGLVTDAHETKLAPNQSPDLANVVFNNTGSIKTRNGYLRYNGDVAGSSSDEANTGASTGTITLDDPGDYVAQTFQVGSVASIVQVDFYLEMDTSGQEQYVQAQLWSGSTGPSAFIADAQILLVSGDSETEYSFRFRVPRSLAATTEYAVVLVPYVRGSTQSINTVLVHRTGSAYGSGAAYISTDSGINWSAVASADLKFNVYTGGNTGGTGLVRYYGDGGIQQTLAKFGTGLYRGNDGTGALTSITLGNGSTLASAEFVDYTISNGTLLLVDNFNKIQKYRGSTNANYSTGTLTATNGDATVAGSGTSWNTTTNAEVGEYIKLPDGKWYKIISIASDTSLEIEVDYQGATLAGQAYTISPWGEVQGDINSATAPTSLVRPTPTYIENHKNRIWTLEGNTLSFSALDTSVDGEHFNDFDSANNAGAIIIPEGKGDSGSGLYSLGNALFVFQRRSIWGLYGSSPATFELRNISNEVGMINYQTLVEWGDVLVFLSDNGVYMFDGSNLKNMSDGVVQNSINMWANLSSPTATLWGNRYLIAYSPDGSSTNAEALFVDLTKNIWGKIEGLYAGSWSTWGGGTDSGQIYFSSSNQGTIYRWDVGGHDDGYEITTRYDTPSLGFEAPTNDKTLKKFYLQQLSLGDWNMTTQQYSDINADTFESQVNLSPGSASLWDVAEWDDSSWSAEGTIQTNRIAEFQGVAKYFKFRLLQTGYDEGIEALGITATSRVRRLR